MNFKELTIKCNFNQNSLSQYLNTSQQCISSWFCGRTTPNLTNIEKLKKVFNCSYDTLISALINTQQNATKKE